MLKSNTVQFFIEPRTVDKKIEWALYCQFLNCNWWVITTYQKEPSKKQVDRDITLIKRTMEFYHLHLEIPRFDIEMIQKT